MAVHDALATRVACQMPPQPCFSPPGTGKTIVCKKANERRLRRRNAYVAAAPTNNVSTDLDHRHLDSGGSQKRPRIPST